MNKFRLFLCCAAALLCLNACDAAGRKDDNMAVTPYTDHQKCILMDAGMSQERLDSGSLIPPERRLLEVLAAAEGYLAERYPQETFRFTGMDHSAPLGMTYHFLVSAGDAGFAVLVRFEENGTFGITDSYFSVIKQRELNELVEETLASFGLQAKADVDLAGLYGADYSAELPLRTTLQQGQSVGVYGWVFAAHEPGAEAQVPEIAQALCQAGLCGGFQLRLVEGVTLQQAFESERTETAFVARECYVSLPSKSSEVK